MADEARGRSWLASSRAVSKNVKWSCPAWATRVKPRAARQEFGAATPSTGIQGPSLASKAAASPRSYRAH